VEANRIWLSPLVAMGLWVSGFPGTQAAVLPACPAQIQKEADQALNSLAQRQTREDGQLRSHPTASYATMNGPVLRELEKRQQREALAESLQARAGNQHNCRLQGPDF